VIFAIAFTSTTSRYED